MTNSYFHRKEDIGRMGYKIDSSKRLNEEIMGKEKVHIEKKSSW